MHELEHAYQHKLADNNMDNSIEIKLINASFVLEQAMKNPKFLTAICKGDIPAQDVIIYILQNRELYKNYYALNPTERLAQINSFGTIANMLEPIKKYIPNLHEFQNASLIEEMLKGYQESWSQGGCPTQVYLLGTRQSKVWSEFNFFDLNSSKLMANVSKEYNLSRRLHLGLPVTYSEYEKTYEWLQSTNKFNM